MSKISLVAKKEVSLEDIEIVECNLDIQFPADFKNWILKNGIGYPQPNCFEVGRDVDVFNNFISFNLEVNTNIINLKRDLQDRLPNNFIPFGRDPFGNLLCFDYSNNQSVVFWDHEILDLDYQKITVLARTFTDFLDMLFSDSEDEE